MAFKTVEDYDRLARGNEDRFEQVEKFCTDALESLDNGDPEMAKERIDNAAHLAAEGIRLNLVATQK